MPVTSAAVRIICCFLFYVLFVAFTHFCGICALYGLAVLCFMQELQNEICAENPDAVGDLYLDIAEAYMNVGLHSSAKPLLYSLVTSANYNMVCCTAVCFDCFGYVS